MQFHISGRLHFAFYFALEEAMKLRSEVAVGS